MIAIRAIAVLAAVSAASAFPSMDSPALDDNVVRRVNSDPSLPWTAGRNAYFEGWTVDQVVRSMGVLPEDVDRFPKLRYPAATVAALPANFSWIEQNPACTNLVRNQGECGSCWAVSAASTISDRHCIASSNGTASGYVDLSALDLVTCDIGGFSGNNGCQGGQLGAAWQYAQQYGLVDSKCYPYGKADGGPIPTCAPSAQPCMPPTFVPTPQCTQQCADGDQWSAAKRKFVTSVYGLGSVADIKAEIVKNGPVQAAFTVYSDFVHYKSGVYKKSPSATPLGGHAVEVVGYGTAEDGSDYFEVKNSWASWGDHGFFLIGVDQCGIADSMVAGTVA